MIDPKLSLNEAIDIFKLFLRAKQDEVYESRVYMGSMPKPVRLRVSELLCIEEYLNDAKE